MNDYQIARNDDEPQPSARDEWVQARVATLTLERSLLPAHVASGIYELFQRDDDSEIVAAMAAFVIAWEAAGTDAECAAAAKPLYDLLAPGVNESIYIDAEIDAAAEWERLDREAAEMRAGGGL